MATTTPDSLFYPTQSDQIAPLESVFAAQANSVQTALSQRQRYSYVWADDTARAAQTGMTTGATGYVLSNASEYLYEAGAWRRSTPHAEYTSSVTAPSATRPLIGVGSYVAASSTTSNFVIPSGSGQYTVQYPGIYALSIFASSTNGNFGTGVGFLQLSSSTTGGGDPDRITRGSFIASDDTMTLSMPNLYVAAANQNYYVILFQQSGASRTVNFRVRWTRIG